MRSQRVDAVTTPKFWAEHGSKAACFEWPSLSLTRYPMQPEPGAGKDGAGWGQAAGRDPLPGKNICYLAKMA